MALSVDDFGAGYSSLGYLKDLRVDAVNRQSLEMEREPRNAAIVRSTVDLGRNLGLEVIAEGVESRGATTSSRLGATTRRATCCRVRFPRPSWLRRSRISNSSVSALSGGSRQRGGPSGSSPRRLPGV